MDNPFFGKIWPILTFVMVKNEKFWLLSWNINHLFYIHNFFLFHEKCQKFSFLSMSKDISCQNEKRVIQIFHTLYSRWKTTRLLITSYRNMGENFTYFCLEHKTENGCWDLCFTLRSKIHVFGSTFSKKVYAVIWLVLEITTLKLKNK